jgi:hypothetical protein
MIRDVTASEWAEINQNLFPKCIDFVHALPDFPWHRDATGRITACRAHSSQALAISVFGTIASLATRDAIVNAWVASWGIPSSTDWDIQPERVVPKEVFGEPRSTQVDVSIESKDALILMECKFTENDGGGCSQVNRLQSGARAGERQCNGQYRLQTNPVNNVAARCALSGKGIRYWELIPEVLGIANDRDYDPCPFRGGWFQWMRNLVAARALSSGKLAMAVVVYADGSFPIVAKLRGDDWQAFASCVQDGPVALRTATYQQLLALAASATGEGAIGALEEWLARRVAMVEHSRSNARSVSRQAFGRRMHE